MFWLFPKPVRYSIFMILKSIKSAASPKGQPWVPTPSFCFDLYRKIMAVPELDLEDLY